MRKVEPLLFERHRSDAVPTGLNAHETTCQQLAHLYTDGHLTDQSLVYLAALLDGAKPGMTMTDKHLFGSVSEHLDSPMQIRDTDVYQTLADAALPRRVTVLGHEVLDTPHRVNPTPRHVLYHIATDPMHLAIAPPIHHEGSLQDIEREHQEDVGEFLGVPALDNTWWESSDLTKEDATPLLEAADIDPATIDGLRFARLVPYLPRPTEDGVRRAVDRGKSYYDAAQTFDNIVGEDLATRAAEAEIARAENLMDWITG